MDKILLIARSEYLRRVRSKTFVFTTLLAPLLALVVIALPIVFMALAEDEAGRVLAVVDETGRLAAPLAEALPEAYLVESTTAPVDTLRARVLDGRLDGFFVLPAGLLDGTADAAYYSRGVGGLAQQAALHVALRDVVRAARIRAAGAPDAVLDLLDARTGLRLVTVSAEGDAADGAVASTAVAYVLGLLIYIAVLIYGVMVMRGVIEEKANRIVEVIASSARPFELMMGKVLGIGAVGLTQLVGWSVLMAALGAVIGPLLALVLTPEVLNAPGVNLPQGAPGELPFDPEELPALLGRLLSPALLVAFVGFFLGGYLLYSSLFAAVGSAVESESDAQTLQLPIMLPVILPVFFLPSVLAAPDSGLSVFLSLFPFSSPILMVVRMAASEVPLWEVLLAFLLLIAAFVGMIALAARIYRVGILMYGKRATFRDLWRWMRTA
jgi:ABC-2 type transport system permease protein